MVEFTIPKGSKIITSIKRKSFRDVGNTSSQNTVTKIRDLVFIPRLGTITPLEWDVSYGVASGLAASVRAEFYLALIDVDNLPQIAGLSDRALWAAAQFWLSMTEIGVINTYTREVQDFFNPTSFNFSERADYTQRLAISLLTFFSQTETADAIGVLTYQEDLIQRKFGNDNSTFVRDDGDWEDFASDEDDGDGGD